MPTASNVLMIQPVNFGFNSQTSVNNSFQANDAQEQVQELALAEFKELASKLIACGIDVTIVEDTLEPHTPDSIFPNNWISFHDNGTVVLFPMFAENRRQERKDTVLKAIDDKFKFKQTLDFTGYEAENLFLEGTGSMVLDKDNRLAYACLSPRTSEKVLREFGKKCRYEPVIFNAFDEKNMPIYHTNVIMCVADRYLVICLDCITSQTERNMLVNTIEGTGKALITISVEQMNHFAGNMLQLANLAGQKFLIMSTQAYESLTIGQIALLESFNPIIHSPLHTIEKNGGGSARCMIAEIYLPEYGA